ncbi:MAG: hypothetical protein NDI94_02975 [Candidatus Woesearchaeota archaeon]|nr:hypothetical protein [Candidatus Woesearchaeota archaeon]
MYQIDQPLRQGIGDLLLVYSKSGSSVAGFLREQRQLEGTDSFNLELAMLNVPVHYSFAQRISDLCFSFKHDAAYGLLLEEQAGYDQFLESDLRAKMQHVASIGRAPFKEGDLIYLADNETPHRRAAGFIVGKKGNDVWLAQSNEFQDAPAYSHARFDMNQLPFYSIILPAK